MFGIYIVRLFFLSINSYFRHDTFRSMTPFRESFQRAGSIVRGGPWFNHAPETSSGVEEEQRP